MGHQNPSHSLLALFAAWACSPFVALLLANVRSKRGAVPIRAALHLVSVVVAAVSLAAYGEVISMPSGAKPAFVFLVVPLGSWVLMTVVSLAARVSRRRRGSLFQGRPLTARRRRPTI